MNKNLLEYVTLLKRLDDLIAEGKGDGEEADRLRDQMDDPWSRLTEEDIADLRLKSLEELVAQAQELNMGY